MTMVYFSSQSFLLGNVILCVLVSIPPLECQLRQSGKCVRLVPCGTSVPIAVPDAQQGLSSGMNAWMSNMGEGCKPCRSKSSSISGEIYETKLF